MAEKVSSPQWPERRYRRTISSVKRVMNPIPSRVPSWTIALAPDVSSLHHMSCATHPDPLPLPRRGGEGRVRGTYDAAPRVREQCGLVDPPETLAISRSRHDGTVAHAMHGG